MNAVAWEEFAETRTIATPRGPLVVNKGDVVMIVVRQSWAEHAEVIANLDQKPDRQR